MFGFEIELLNDQIRGSIGSKNKFMGVGELYSMDFSLKPNNVEIKKLLINDIILSPCPPIP